ncbi:MAG TPA: phosphatase PAP2 family protein [Candidatus Binatia bacterium]|jgi:membrane-associated phospholipid phosphatase|nr:phosphatase PAP2 family protein [Candidatus Binatia bacterium]
MKQFLSTLPRNIIACFEGRLIIWHVIAILLTFILVASGFDWRYFASTREPSLRSWMFPAVQIGGLLPIVLPLFLFALGSISTSAKTTLAGWAVGQAELIGSLVSSAYKAVTGRAHPTRGVGADLSHLFHFGFLRGGVFWGWPSSHTTIAFAMAATTLTLFPKRKWVGYVAIAYALYVGVGVSMTIHWFSDFAAGAIIGTVIGVVVGKSFLLSCVNDVNGQICPANASAVLGAQRNGGEDLP